MPSSRTRCLVVLALASLAGAHARASDPGPREVLGPVRANHPPRLVRQGPIASAADGVVPVATPIATVEGVSEFRLPSGLRIVVAHEPSQATESVTVNYDAGSRFEAYGETGMAHLLEHMLFRGTPRHPDLFAELSARRVVWKGTTLHDAMRFIDRFPATESNLAWMLEVEADRMVHALLSEDARKRELRLVLDEIAGRPPWSWFSAAVSETAYRWHAYGKDPFGDRTDLEAVSLAAIRRFYEAHFRPDTATVIISGPIATAKVLDLALAHFAPIPRPAAATPTTHTVEPRQDGERSVVVRRAGDVQFVAVAYHTVAASDALFPASEAVADLMGKAKHSRLWRVLIETGLALDVGVVVHPSADPGSIVFYAQCDADAPLEPVREALVQAIEDLRSHPPTEWELLRFQETFADRFDGTVGDPIARVSALSDWQVYGDWRLFFLHRDRVAQLELADVARFARVVLTPENRTIGMFHPTDELPKSPTRKPADIPALVEGYHGAPPHAASPTEAERGRSSRPR